MNTERRNQALQQQLVEDMASRARDRREPATGEPGGEATRPKESERQASAPQVVEPNNLLDWEEAQQGAAAKPKTLYVYRWPDGRTQVRAPDINDPADVIDMLQEALRAMTEGEPVRQQ